MLRLFRPPRWRRSRPDSAFAPAARPLGDDRKWSWYLFAAIAGAGIGAVAILVTAS